MIFEKASINNDVLRKLQLTQQEILDEIVRICNLYNLKYYLIGGTLLGAVRHKGFIPWDDDLDIAMPREDFDRFLEICKENLNGNYCIHWISTDKKYWLPFAKVRKKNTVIAEGLLRGIDVNKGIYVDIFPLDNALSIDSSSQRNATTFIKFLNTALIRKIGVRYGNTTFKLRLLDLAVRFVSFNFLHRLSWIFAKKHNKKTSPYYINYGSNYSTVKQTMPKDVFDPAGKLYFENKEYSVPKDYDYVLSRIYGDYMKLPPEEERVFRHLPDLIDFGDDN